MNYLGRVVFSLMLLAGMAGIAAPVHAAAPTLRAISLPGKVLFQGTGWGTAPVWLQLRSGLMLTGLEIKPNAAGLFQLLLLYSSPCGGDVLRAGDLRGHHRKARVAPHSCPFPAVQRTKAARFMLNIGTVLKPRVVKIANNRPSQITVRAGEEIRLFESGTAAGPAFSPTVDPAYLVLVDQEVVPPGACMQPDCPAEYSWTWIAAKPGTTAIDLSALCRKATPPCMVPDFEVRVTILARVAGNTR